MAKSQTLGESTSACDGTLGGGGALSKRAAVFWHPCRLAMIEETRTQKPHAAGLDAARAGPNPPQAAPAAAPAGGATSQPRLTALAHGGGCGCKVAPALLAQILRTSTPQIVPSELLVGIETADDAAVYRLNDEQALVATTDFFTPIVDDPFDFGRIAATNAISDVYAMGATPVLALAIVGMPVSVLSVETIRTILEGGAAVCQAAGIPIAGGHTIDSVEPIYGLVAIGLAHPERVARNSGARPGDRLVLGKPLGVGVYSAALKKDALDAQGYACLIDTTTRLNTPGPELAALKGVHALSDVTGFGLAGHALEFARGSGCRLRIDWRRVPLLPGAKELAGRGFVTGASNRNWASYGAQVQLPEGFSEVDRALLTDPQTSGGLLVSCAPDAVPMVLEVFGRHGFGAAAACGSVLAAADAPLLQVTA
ncbi:MAG TPA: selenide, water dikinase SelD [Burkholderiaceae bacterium]|nr:selenide, water dikinase SelD [Burkholderiaceae bacterium]